MKLKKTWENDLITYEVQSLASTDIAKGAMELAAIASVTNFAKSDDNYKPIMVVTQLNFGDVMHAGAFGKAS